MYSALIAKLRRIKEIFDGALNFQRVEVAPLTTRASDVGSEISEDYNDHRSPGVNGTNSNSVDQIRMRVAESREGKR